LSAPAARRNGPRLGPMRCDCPKSGLAVRLLRDGATELQRPTALLATACGKRNDGAQQRYDSDFLGTHDCTSRIANAYTGALCAPSGDGQQLSGRPRLNPVDNAKKSRFAHSASRGSDSVGNVMEIMSVRAPGSGINCSRRARPRSREACRWRRWAALGAARCKACRRHSAASPWRAESAP
jgi:hypothetical protein